MATKVDGTAYRIDVKTSIYHDGASLLVEGFPDGFLTGAAAEAPIFNFGTEVEAGEWNVEIDDTTVLLSLPKADVEALDVGSYEYELILDVADGSAPPIIGGLLTVSKDRRRTNTSASYSVDVVPVGATVTIEQVVALGSVTLDGGGPEDDDGDTYDGGTP